MIKRMKRDIAERFAAIEVDTPISYEDAHTIIETFLTYLARCEVCEGIGIMEVGHEVGLDVAEQGRGTVLTHAYFPIGTAITCPRCGGRGGPTQAHDPEHTDWHCYLHRTVEGCQSEKSEAMGAAAQHKNCGYKVLVPVPDGV